MYDLLIIGGGPGGCAAAIDAAKGGLTVALFEGREVGGTCLNRGCIPTKALLHGVELGANFEELNAQKNAVVDTLRTGMERGLKGAKVTVIPHFATITGANTVVAGGETYEGTTILVATGSVPARPPIPGMDLEGVVTSDEVLDQIEPRTAMVIIGGGVIGVELAAVWASKGTKVTIIEALDRILANMDRELSQSVAMQLKKDGVEIFTGATVDSITPTDGLTVTFTHKGEEKQISAPTVLAAMGRRPNLGSLFEGISPQMERGFLVVDEQYCTSIPSIRAIGDVIPGPQLAHKAEAEGHDVAALLLGKSTHHDMTHIPACVYTTPEVAQVGLTADQCKEQGIPAVAGKCVMGGNGRTVIAGGRRGLMKLVFHKETRVLLGAHLCCERATDLISELTLAITLGLTADQLALPVRPHPTFAEAITEAVKAGLVALDK